MDFSQQAEVANRVQCKTIEYPYPNHGVLQGACSRWESISVHEFRQVNVGLKRIARNCGINRVLSYHVARYTFASQICLSQGVPIESVSRMLGHKHIQTTQRYARLNNEKIGNDMQQLSARLATKFNF